MALLLIYCKICIFRYMIYKKPSSILHEKILKSL